MNWSIWLGAGGTSLCLLMTAFLFFVLAVLVVFRLRRRATADPSAHLKADTRPLRDVEEEAHRRELLLHRIDPALEALGDNVQVTKGSKGDLRLLGTLQGHPAYVDIDAGGRIVRAYVESTFPAGTLTLHARQSPDDPDGLLLLLDALEVDQLQGELREAKVIAVECGATGVTATSDIRLHEVDALTEADALARTLAALDHAIRMWQDRKEMAPPSQGPPSLPPPPPPPKAD